MDGRAILETEDSRESRRSERRARRHEEKMLRSWGKNGSTDFNFIIGLISGIGLTLVLLVLFAIFFHF